MNSKKYFSGKAGVCFTLLLIAATVFASAFIVGRVGKEIAQAYASTPEAERKNPQPEAAGGGGISGSKVYFTSDISSSALQSVYNALERRAEGRVAVKIHTGEPGGKNFLQPALIKDLVQAVKGTIVESNTAYTMGRRHITALHKQVAIDHGFTAIAPVDILDEDGDIRLPVKGGAHITEDIVGSHFRNYDFYIVLSHFKGHSMGGFGGAVKNMSIGIASSRGKSWIHSAGKSESGIGEGTPQDDFLESMAEAAKAVADDRGEKILYINVMNRLSIQCDCMPNPAEPDMHDIGILASLDPVALDKACVDLVYAAPDGASLIERMESVNGIHTLDHAARIGLGSLSYELIKL
ncbi:MAG: DUF362 domain-containing protein [Synergistaceae bacterium]|jgi:uncharacterized Fe-S center protein|nr:DUF362 domain-containing protein [Synergistaceae bacterium]